MEIIRIPLIARGNSQNKLLNAIGMTANYFSFIISGRRWVRSRQARALDADLAFTVEVSPMTQALIGCWYGKRFDIPVFLYVQDLWPENVVTVTGIHSPIVIKPIEEMVKYIYDHTDEIFTTSPSFVKEIVKRGAEKERVHYWPQYAEEFCCPIDRIEAEERLRTTNTELAFLVEKINAEDAFYIAFTGNIGTAQGLDILPKTAEVLKDKWHLHSGRHLNVHFIIVGDGRYQDKFEQEIEERDVSDMFIFVSRQRAEVIPDILALADAAFLSFGPDNLWQMTIPAKLQSYMACGKPIIAAAEGETERVIKEAECGVCVPIGNSISLAGAIESMVSVDLKMLSENSRNYAEKYFKKSQLMDEMENLIKVAV